MEQCEFEGLGELVYGLAGHDTNEPVSPIALAKKILGAENVRYVDGGWVCHDGALIKLFGKWQIHLRRRDDVVRLAFACAHELGEFILKRENYKGADVEDCANSIAGVILAPGKALSKAVRALGFDLPGLAKTFTTSETCVSLRLGERLGVPLATVSPARVRTRGPDSFVWPADSEIRRMAKHPPKGTRGVRMRDDHHRSVLFVEEIVAA